jgi:hypothetical protein
MLTGSRFPEPIKFASYMPEELPISSRNGCQSAKDEIQYLILSLTNVQYLDKDPFEPSLNRNGGKIEHPLFFSIRNIHPPS